MEKMADFEKKQIGKRIREARIKRFKGTVTMANLARFLSVAYRTYQNWALGFSSPRHNAIIKLANILKTDPAYLLFGDKQKDSEVEQGH